MASWVVFAAHREDDEALWNSRWVAHQTLARVGQPAVLLEGNQAVRASLESALVDPEVRGVALFSHGRPHAVFGVDGLAAFDATNLPLVESKWVHAFACLTGHELARCATDTDIFVGYEAALIVNWCPTDLPHELEVRLARLVTETTVAIFEGIRDQRELRRRANAAAEDLAAWISDNDPDGHLGLCVLAQQLVDRMVVEGRSGLVQRIMES